jgi:hypothetical protein
MCDAVNVFTLCIQFLEELGEGDRLPDHICNVRVRRQQSGRIRGSGPLYKEEEELQYRLQEEELRPA